MTLNRICEKLSCTVDELRTKHFFVQMEGVEPTLFCAIGIGIGINDGYRTWRECVVDESRFPLEQGYKITLKAIDGSNGYEHYYMMDFLQLLEKGFILPTTEKNSHIEHIIWEEPIENTCAVYRHEADVVIEG